SLSATVLIHHKILQGRKKECPETSLLLISAAQRILREKMCEETLNNVLCVGRGIAATPNKSVEWRPIGFAQNRKSLLRVLISASLSCLQHNGPVRRLKRRASLL